MVDGAPEVQVRDGGIEHGAHEFTKQVDFCVGGLRHGGAKRLKVASGPDMGLGEAPVKHLDGLVGHIRETLREEGYEDGIAVCGWGPLEGLGARLAGEMHQELEAVGVEGVGRPVLHPCGP